eukprot:6676953-Heterocapsa_arctica.AAC.1
MELCSASCPGRVISLIRDRLANTFSVPGVGAAATTTPGEARAFKTLAAPRSKTSTGRGSDERVWT